MRMAHLLDSVFVYGNANCIVATLPPLTHAATHGIDEVRYLNSERMWSGLLLPLSA
jgi:hypothetical protein